MEQTVNNALLQRTTKNTLEHISLDEKAYTKGHNYVTVLIDGDRNYVVDMVEGRREEDVQKLFNNVNTLYSFIPLKRANIDMWKPYLNVVRQIAPQALIVHDKFHLFQQLSQAIDKTRRKEVKTNVQLKNQKYTVLKN